jgi:hypothetical protein
MLWPTVVERLSTAKPVKRSDFANGARESG